MTDYVNFVNDNPSLSASTRPQSENKVDLHVYLVPSELWQERLHSAFNQIISETISAGFLRVHPETSLYQLREEISRQLGFEIVPQDFVYCKSVGRCLTKVRTRQEKELKAKHFLPPHAYCPEIFVLDADVARRMQMSSDSSVASNRSSNRQYYASSPTQKRNMFGKRYDQASPVPFDSGLDMEDEMEKFRPRNHSLPEEANIEASPHEELDDKSSNMVANKYASAGVVSVGPADQEDGRIIFTNVPKKPNDSNVESLLKEIEKQQQDLREELKHFHECKERHQKSNQIQLKALEDERSKIIENLRQLTSTETEIDHLHPESHGPFEPSVKEKELKEALAVKKLELSHLLATVSSQDANDLDTLDELELRKCRLDIVAKELKLQLQENQTDLAISTESELNVTSLNESNHENKLTAKDSKTNDDSPSHSPTSASASETFRIPPQLQDKSQSELNIESQAFHAPLSRKPSFEAGNNDSGSYTISNAVKDVVSPESKEIGTASSQKPTNSSQDHDTLQTILDELNNENRPNDSIQTNQYEILYQGSTPFSKNTSADRDVIPRLEPNSIPKDDNISFGFDSASDLNNTQNVNKEIDEKMKSLKRLERQLEEKREFELEIARTSLFNQIQQKEASRKLQISQQIEDEEVRLRKKQDEVTNLFEIESKKREEITTLAAFEENIRDKILEGERILLEQQRLAEEEAERRRREEEERLRRLDEERQRRLREEAERLRREREEAERLRRLQEDAERRRLLEEEELRRRLEEEEEARRRAEQEQNDAIPKLLIDEASFARPDSPLDPEEDKRRERELLLQELQKYRDERIEIERRRDDYVRRAKLLQAKIQNMRNQARDLWKKRYFEEKKKTTPLEDQANKLRAELENHHRKMVSTMTTRLKEGKNVDTADDTQQLNLRIQATRMQHEIEELQRRVDEAKMKLTAEVKLRTQAEGELRAMKAELTQRKLNLSMTRNQQLSKLGTNVGMASSPLTVN